MFLKNVQCVIMMQLPINTYIVITKTVLQTLIVHLILVLVVSVQHAIIHYLQQLNVMELLAPQIQSVPLKHAMMDIATLVIHHLVAPKNVMDKLVQQTENAQLALVMEDSVLHALQQLLVHCVIIKVVHKTQIV